MKPPVDYSIPIQERMNDRGRPRFVYLARVDIGELVPYHGRIRMISLIKIGTSIFPSARIVNLRHDFNAPVTMLACFPGGFAKERELHERFHNSRLPPVYNNIRGELFYPTRDLLAFIEEISEEGVDGVVQRGTI